MDHEIEAVDLRRLKTFRLRIDTSDPLYRGMKKLKVRGKDLDLLPHEIFHLHELEVLDLSPEREACLYYQVREVPHVIGKLVNLKILMLDTNELVELPKQMSLLINLEGIALNNNLLTSLPSGFDQLQSLTSVHMANNEFETFPLVLCELEFLQFLDMSDNKLESLPDDISKLQEMETLLLNINRLTKLPDSICKMSKLRSLWIGENDIKELPRRFGDLKLLDWGFRHTSSSVIDGNPMQSPPLEICKKGVYYIDRYFRQSQAN